MRKICLIAGKGRLPEIIASDARSQGYTVFIIALEPLAERSLYSSGDNIKWINIGKFGEIIETLKKYDVREAIMAGKVPKTVLYKSNIVPDIRALKLLFSLKDRNDDSILKAISKELKKEGIKLLDITTFSSNLLTPEGILTKDRPSNEEWKDISFGWKVAKEIGKLDIGQTVVVKNQAVMAVEAIEGTDEAIRRGGRLAGKGAVVVKISKPHQDMKLDVPVIGIDTVTVMAEVSARVLSLEAKKSIILDKDSVIEKSNKEGISVVGYTE